MPIVCLRNCDITNHEFLFCVSVVKLYRGGERNEHGRSVDAPSPRTGSEASFPRNQAMRRGSTHYAERKSATGTVTRISIQFHLLLPYRGIAVYLFLSIKITISLCQTDRNLVAEILRKYGILFVGISRDTFARNLEILVPLFFNLSIS